MIEQTIKCPHCQGLINQQTKITAVKSKSGAIDKVTDTVYKYIKFNRGVSEIVMLSDKYLLNKMTTYEIQRQLKILLDNEKIILSKKSNGYSVI